MGRKRKAYCSNCEKTQEVKGSATVCEYWEIEIKLSDPACEYHEFDKFEEKLNDESIRKKFVPNIDPVG